MPDPRPSRRHPRALAALAMVVALVAFPLGALATHQYGDVPDSNPFHGDITAITNAGITSGCGGGNYCPDRNVTRAEMAAFMNRLGALASNKTPVVNAAKLDGWSSEDLNRVAYNSSASLADGDLVNTATLSTTITTPFWGYLLIWGQSSLFFEGLDGQDAVSCKAQLDNVDVAGAFSQQDLQYTATINADQQTCGVHGAVRVCSGDTYTVDFEVSGIGADTNVGTSSVMVEYVPFNGSGATPWLSCLIILPAPEHVEAPEK